MPESISLTARLLTLGVGLVIWLTQYFIINNLARPTHRKIIPSITIDEMIPFIPGFIAIYLSTYLFGILPFFLISNSSLFIGTTIGYITVALISSTIHVLYPSQVMRHEITQSESFSWFLIAWFQGICKPYGNFPSTHMAFSVISVFIGFIVGGPILGSIFLIWACMIALSALSIKQHYLLDIIIPSPIMKLLRLLRP